MDGEAGNYSRREEDYAPDRDEHRSPTGPKSREEIQSGLLDFLDKIKSARGPRGPFEKEKHYYDDKHREDMVRDLNAADDDEDRAMREEEEGGHLRTERRQGLVGQGARQDFPDNQNHWGYGHLDALHGYPPQPYDPHGFGMSEQDIVAYHDGYQTARPHQRVSSSDNSQTDGKIVGLCPGCTRAIRKHKTMHGNELRHLHNNSPRCFGDKTAAQNEFCGAQAPDGGNGEYHECSLRANHEGEHHCMGSREYPCDHQWSAGRRTAVEGPGLLEAADVGGKALNGVEHELEKPADEWAYRAESALQAYADYLGRPDANNPTGRGPDEYKARTWDSYLTTRPMQSAEDRNVNTPVLPQEPIKTRNINTPTTGAEDHERAREDDEDEDDD